MELRVLAALAPLVVVHQHRRVQESKFLDRPKRTFQVSQQFLLTQQIAVTNKLKLLVCSLKAPGILRLSSVELFQCLALVRLVLV